MNDHRRLKTCIMIFLMLVCVQLSGCLSNRFLANMISSMHLVLVHDGRYAIIPSGDRQYHDSVADWADWDPLESYDKWLSASSPVSEFEKQLRVITEDTTRDHVFMFLTLGEECKSEAVALADVAAKRRGVTGTGTGQIGQIFRIVREPVGQWWHTEQPNG